MGELRGKRALVTGSGQGLGLAIARRLAAAGCHLALHYHTSRAGAETLAAELRAAGATAVTCQGDLTREADAVRLVTSAAAGLGGLDILVNNTGDLVQRRRLGELDAAYWRQMVEVNLSSMLYVTREAVPHLARAGQASIVNLASLAGRKGGHPGSLAYATCKGAVLTWTRALATELAPQGIRVNAVAPGFILGSRFHATHTTAAAAQATIATIPLGRAGTPDDVARAVAYLASEYDGFITAATLDINGGTYAC
jgi:3-oxoacyl-[acyl-carrier protein] reductase